MGQKLLQVPVVEITSDIPCFLKYGGKDKQTSDSFEINLSARTKAHVLSVHSFIHVLLFATPWTPAHHASLSMGYTHKKQPVL